MARPGDVDRVDHCDTCGAVGFPELIMTCSKCKIASEHLYCMRVYPKEIPRKWFCEFCQSRNETMSPKCGGNRNISSSSACSRRQNPVATGKVKFIPEEEVIKLSQGKIALKSGSANSVTFMSRKTSVRSKDAIPKNSTLAAKPNPCIIPTDGNIPRHNGLEKSLMVNQQSPHLSHKVSASERKAANSPAKEYENKELSPRSVRPIDKPESCLPVPRSVPIQHSWENPQLKDQVMPVKEVETLNKLIVKPTQEAPSALLPARQSTLIAGSGGTFHDVDELIRCNVGESELQRMLTKLKLYLSYIPSLDVAWRGGFKLKFSTGYGEFYGGFQAQPPCTVHRKAYKLSVQMPQILEVEPICTSVLSDLFQNDCPDLQDVALYFFPSDNIEGSRQDLNNVFELMNAQNSMLKCAFNGDAVELLVCTSKQLDVDSQAIIARVNAQYFLWGVFRRVKYDQAAEEFPDVKNVHMEIDMIGGVDVGRIDLVMPDKPKNLSIISREGATGGSTFRIKDEMITSSCDFNTNVEEKFASSAEIRKKKTVSFGSKLAVPRLLKKKGDEDTS